MFYTAAVTYEDNSGKDSDGREYFLPTKRIHSDINTDEYGDNGLYIGVHTDQSRTNTFLTEGNKKVGNERSTNDKES